MTQAALADLSPRAALWRANQAFTQKLALTRNRLALLLQTADMRGGLPARSRALLSALQTTLDRCYADHSGWRYSVFYEDPQTQRAVQTDEAAISAGQAFARTLRPHLQTCARLAENLLQAPRPALDASSAAGEDLWNLLLDALTALCEFGEEAFA